MMTILHVSCSPRGPASESYRISQKIIEFLLKREPTAKLVNRVIGDGAISHIDESYATGPHLICNMSAIPKAELLEDLGEISSRLFIGGKV